MQTLQFTHALRQIVLATQADQLVGFLSRFLAKGNFNITDQDRQTFSILLFESRVAIAELLKAEDTGKIVKALGVDEIYEPPRLARMLAAMTNQGQAAGIWQNNDYYREFFSFNNTIEWLIKVEKACSQLLEKDKLGETKPEEVVEIELADYEGTSVEIQRVTKLFDLLSNLHTNLARVLGIGDAQLKVVILDSGSNLLVGLKTAVDIVKLISGLFKEIWDKIKYGRFEDFDRKIDSISKGLTVTAVIQQQIENKTLDEETGNNLKYRILADMTTLVGIGAMLPATELSEQVDRERLLTEKRGIKLLEAGKEEPQ